ncbi:MAG: hypothetical protein SFY92_10770 [Verrucomicrobiae bacterium]|nr:hypothetical protein [Verrucomicrobiae bacterium]
MSMLSYYEFKEIFQRNFSKILFENKMHFIREEQKNYEIEYANNNTGISTYIDTRDQCLGVYLSKVGGTDRMVIHVESLMMTLTT